MRKFSWINSIEQPIEITIRAQIWSRNHGITKISGVTAQKKAPANRGCKLA